MARGNGKVRDSSIRLDSNGLGRDRRSRQIRDELDAGPKLIPPSRIEKIKHDTYRLLNGINSPDAVEITCDELVSIVQEIQQNREIVQPLLKLLREADASVTFVGVSPDPKLGTQEVSITISNEATNWETIAITGVTYGHCVLSAADRFSEKTFAGEPQ